VRSRFRRAPAPARLHGLVLSALVGPATHGYGVATRVRADVDLDEGTVYPVLHRLERHGLVWSRWADVEGRRRRVYELTGAGGAAVIDIRSAAAGLSGLGHVVRWSA